VAAVLAALLCGCSGAREEAAPVQVGAPAAEKAVVVDVAAAEPEADPSGQEGAAAGAEEAPEPVADGAPAAEEVSPEQGAADAGAARTLYETQWFDIVVPAGTDGVEVEVINYAGDDPAALGPVMMGVRVGGERSRPYGHNELVVYRYGELLFDIAYSYNWAIKGGGCPNTSKILNELYGWQVGVVYDGTTDQAVVDEWESWIVFKDPVLYHRSLTGWRLAELTYFEPYDGTVTVASEDGASSIDVVVTWYATNGGGSSEGYDLGYFVTNGGTTVDVWHGWDAIEDVIILTCGETRVYYDPSLEATYGTHWRGAGEAGD
jgi:hypothetical protein